MQHPRLRRPSIVQKADITPPALTTISAVRIGMNHFALPPSISIPIPLPPSATLPRSQRHQAQHNGRARTPHPGTHSPQPLPPLLLPLHHQWHAPCPATPNTWTEMPCATCPNYFAIHTPGEYNVGPPPPPSINSRRRPPSPIST